MSHTCHARGCKTHCKPEYLMCPKHWRMVPRRVQLAVYKYYQNGQCQNEPAPSKEWHIAADAAIRCVFEQELDAHRKNTDTIT